MTILAGDIKLVASQVMDDSETGGGAPTSTVIQDGTSNSIFNDISELDQASGRVNLRKTFAHVQTTNTDTYLGANIIVADPPDDPRVSVTIFSTGSVFDRRDEAKNRIEAYLNSGTVMPGYLLENHITGQRSIQIFQRESADVPAVGHTLYLVKNEGLSDQVEQYVRVTRATPEVRTFSYLNGGTYVDYTAVVVTCDISDMLRYDFPGSPPSRAFAAAAGKSIIRDTVVADAATYYGVTPLTSAAAIGDINVKVGSIYSQLVPNSQTETPLIDMKPSADFSHILATSPREISVGGSPFSQRFRIGQSNRAFSYATILKPLPAPGSVKVTYRALGRTYTITDDGNGNLTGAGSGIVSYATGSVNVTLSALPDDRSAVVFYWGQNVSYANRSSETFFRMPEFAITLANRGITPGSFTATWESGGVAKTATASANGDVSGDATGYLNHVNGVGYLKPTAMPDPGAQMNFNYTWSAMVEETKTMLSPDPTGSVTFSLTQEPIPGSVEVEWITSRVSSSTNGTSINSGSTAKTTGTSASQVSENPRFNTALGY